MIAIRPDQFEAFEQVAANQFRQRLAAFLRAEIPEEAGPMPPDELDARIRDAERRAAKYRISSEAGVAQFACLTFYAGPEFDEAPEVRDFLERTDNMTQDEKLDRLIEELPDEPS